MPLSRPRQTERTPFLAEIFLISAAALVLEISYTRIISFKLYYYYTYLVIGLALLGLGSGAVVVAVSKRLKAMSTARLLLGCSVAGAVGVVVGYLAVSMMPLDTILLWEGSTGQRAKTMLQLLGICLGLYVSFLPIGVIIATLFARRPQDINRLYFSDLAGAALACIVVVPVMAWIGPVAAVGAAAVILLAVALRLSTTTDQVLRIGTAVGVAVLAVVVVRPSVAPEIRAEASKGLRPETNTSATRWSALFRVDAVEIDLDTADHDPNTLLFHDGIAGSAIWQWDGDPASLTRFDDDDRSVPFSALGTPPERMLIIGAAGGNEVQAALHFGAEQIDAVELNPATADLLRGQYADYAGNVTTQPDVNYVVGDGRSYLAERDTEYDLIWFVAPDSYAASNAASSGAFVLSESYLYTQEMLEEALEHLTPRGMVVMQFGENDYEGRPNRTARLAATARNAFEASNIAPFDQHIAVTTTYSETFFYGVSTTILKRTPFTADELDRIEERVPVVPTMELRYLPGRPGDEATAPVNQVITLDDDALRGLFDSYQYDVRGITDDRPFFWHFTPFADVVGGSEGRFDVEIAVGERVLLLLLLIAIVLAAVFLLGPFLLVRGTWRRLPDKATSAPIFGILGLAFIAFEITLIQKFSLFLGYPTYSLTVTLMSILLFTGVGALVSPRWHARPTRLLSVLAASIVVLALFYILVSPSIIDALLDWPRLAKMGVVVVLCAPLGVCLGMFMPFAITLVSRGNEHSEESVAWGWAINGFFSVIGSTLTTIVSMTYGFRTVLFASMLLYLVAIGLLAVLARRRPPVSVSAHGPTVGL